MLFADGDGLHQRLAARLQARRHGAEILRPVLLADRFEHLDRDNGVVFAVQVAVVAQLQPDAVLQRQRRDTALGDFQLRRRNRHAMHFDALQRRMFGKAAPAAADLEHALARLQPQRIDDALVFALLRRVQRQAVVAIEQRARVGPAGVEPQLVEIVADIVMGMDVALAALAGIRPQPVPQAVPAARQRAAEQQLVQRCFVGERQAQQRRQVGRVDHAGRIGFGKADVAGAQDALAGAPVMQVQGGARRRMGVAKHHARAARRDQFEMPVADLVQQREEQAGAGGRRHGGGRQSASHCSCS